MNPIPQACTQDLMEHLQMHVLQDEHKPTCDHLAMECNQMVRCEHSSCLDRNQVVRLQIESLRSSLTQDDRAPTCF